MSHVTCTNESCHTYEWVMSHVRMSHVTRINESCHTYEWVMSHVWMSHVTRMHERFKVLCNLHIHITHGWMIHDSFTWMCHVNKSCSSHDKSCSSQEFTHSYHTWMNDTWLIHMSEYHPVCCSVLQCVAVCCSVLQCVAVSFIWANITTISPTLPPSWHS